MNKYKNGFLKSKNIKILLPLVGVLIIVALVRNGYEFGQWLYKLLH